MVVAACIVSLLALAGTIAPPLLFFTGSLTLDQTKLWMAIATAAWFVAAPLWLSRSSAHR